MPFRVGSAVLVLLAAAIVGHSQTHPLPPEVRYLLPVFVVAQGPNGSMFTTDFELFNPSFPAQIRGLRLACFTLCPPERPAVQIVRTGDTVGSFGSFDRTGRPGLVIKANSADLWMSLRVRDLSRNNFSAGTEIPVIRESEMLTGPLFLVGVPPEGTRFRNRIRVYSFTTGKVRIVYVRSADNAVLGTTTLELNFPAGVPPEEREFYPAFAESAGFPVTGSFTRVQVEPIDGLANVWAFVTTTNNDTQEITIVTPQP